MVILGAISVAFFPAATAVLLSLEGTRQRPLRETLLIAAVLWGVWLVLGTELLSLAGGLRWWPVALWWLLPTAGLGVAAARDRRWAPRLAGAWRNRRRPDWLGCAFLGGVAAVLLATLVVAAATPPNNWDSQTYHLPRQIHWMQQGSVDHYAAPDLRQVMMPPMAEFAGLHLMILSGGDQWANLIQWFALGLTAAAASLLARELGAAARGQSLAALLVVTYPVAAMQATNTKNDVVVALWACAMAYFVLLVWTRRACPPGRAALIGATLGLMVLTKGTGFVVGLPISLAAAVAILRVQRWRGLLTGTAIGAIALTINTGHFSRNVGEFGSLTGPSAAEGGYPLSNETHSPAAIASNLVRNAALHAGTPWDDVNASMESAIGRLHDAMGIELSDPRTTYLHLKFKVFYAPQNESQAGAPVHLALALVIAPVLLGLRRRWLLLIAWLVPAFAFVLFCILLKWQGWHARLHMPMVCLLAPVAATLLESVWRGALAAVVAAVAMFVLTPSLLWSQHKPLLGSPSIFAATWEENMFRFRRPLMEPFSETVEACRQLEPRTFAIIRATDEWIYPFQRAFLRTMADPPRSVALHKHRSQRRDYPVTAPDVIIHTDGRALWMNAHGIRYVPAAHCGQYTVYVPQEIATARNLDPPLPPFSGWNNSQGLDRLEGPYPQNDLPQVRWGLGPATTLRFASDGKATTLVLEARRHREFGQAIVVRLDGEEVGRHAFGEAFEFEEVRLPLAPRRGINELVIEYSAWEQAPRAVALLYRRLQVLPEGYVERADEASGARGGAAEGSGGP